MEQLQSNENTQLVMQNSHLKTGRSYASTLMEIFNVPIVYNNERGCEVLLLPYNLDRLNEMYMELKEIITNEVSEQYNKEEKKMLLERGMPEKMKIVKFNADKGFGFVKPQHGRNIFFHVSDDQEFFPTKKRRFNPIELKEGDEIFVYGTSKEERGLRVTRRSQNNLSEEKISEFKKSFEIDKQALQKLVSRYFFDNLADKEIFALGPTAIDIGIPIKIRDLDLLAECSLKIELIYDDTGLNLLLKNNDKERRIPINTNQKAVERCCCPCFSIDSLSDFKDLKNTIPNSVKGYIVGDSKSRYPAEGEPKGEWMKLSRSSYKSWEVEEVDWNLSILEDKDTEIIGVDDRGKFLVRNKTLDELGLCDNEGVYKFDVCCVVNGEHWADYKGMPYLSYKNNTPKDLKIIEKTLPYYQKYLKEKYTNDFICDLEEHPEKYLIKTQSHIFADASSGEYFVVIDHLDDEIFFDVKEGNGRIKYSLIDHNKVKNAIKNILERTDNLKEILIDKNTSFVEKVMHSYNEIDTVKRFLQPGEGRIRKFEYTEYHPRRIVSGIYDIQEERIIAKSHTCEVREMTGGTHTISGGDGWRRGLSISSPVRYEKCIRTYYYYPLGKIDSIESLVQEIETQGNSHPIFEKILQDKKIEKKFVQDAGKMI